MKKKPLYNPKYWANFSLGTDHIIIRSIKPTLAPDFNGDFPEGLKQYYHTPLEL